MMNPTTSDRTSQPVPVGRVLLEHVDAGQDAFRPNVLQLARRRKAVSFWRDESRRVRLSGSWLRNRTA